MNQEIVNVSVEPPSATPGDLLRIAIEKGASMDQLEKLMDLQERYQANQARKAYVLAMTEFKQNPPEIFKRTNVSFGTTNYNFANLGDVCKDIVSALAVHGFSHSWQMAQLDSGKIEVTCIITHAMGHSEATRLNSAADQSGGKNSIQAIASAVTYLQRYTLLGAVGLATKEMDDDGHSADLDLVTPDQIGQLESLILKSGAERQQFLKFLKVESLGDLPAKSFQKAIAGLEAKLAKKAAA